MKKYVSIVRRAERKLTFSKGSKIFLALKALAVRTQFQIVASEYG